MNKPVIGFAGMTHLGINSAVAAAEKGFSIICYDADKNLIHQLNKNVLPITEPDLTELLSKNINNMKFSSDLSNLRQCDIIYISSDVPTDDHGKSDLSKIEILIESVSDQLSQNANLVILCQVPPGFTRNILTYLKEIKTSSLSNEQLFYQVETLIFGRAMERALYPERFIIGCNHPENPLPTHFKIFLESFQCPILPMRYESAELAKIAINCCLVSSISVANTLSEICENIGADWSEIVPALKMDKRIGQHAYLAPGLGIAGGNLERDLTIILDLSQKYGTHSDVVKAWVDNSRYRKDWVLKILHQKVFSKFPDPTITVLGLAYKENTNSIKNSASITLLNALQNYNVQVFDPAISVNTIPMLRWVIDKESVLDAATNSDVLVIMTPWLEFRQLKLTELAKIMKGRLIIDPYRVLNVAALKAHDFKYYCLGTYTIC